MWEIYTLYMIKEDEKLAVIYYSDRRFARLKKEGEELLKDSNYDRYEIIGMLGMFESDKKEEVLNAYKILEAYEYDDAQEWYVNGKKLCLKN